MMRRFTPLILISLLISSVAWGQVTITTADLPIDFGTSIEREGSDDYMTVDPGSAGANQVWNFSSMEVSYAWTEEWIDPASTPNGSQFPTATHCYYWSDQPTLYFYLETTTTNHLLVGFDAGLFMSTVNLIQAPDNYPMNYGDEWIAAVETPSPFGMTSEVDTTWGWVDGWGTLIDVTGSHNCLRLKTFERSWTVIQGVPSNPIEFYHYHYLVPGGEGFVALTSQADETNPNFTTGFFTRTTGITGIREIPGVVAMPDAITLEPAFPNPFNPATHLSFNLPAAGDVRLAVFDAQGRLVADLQDGWMPAGQYQAQFDAAGLSSGTYFARMVCGDVTQTQTLLLVK